MRCPYCASIDSRVIDSRTSPRGDAVKRRRVCDSCGRRYTTHERVELTLPWVVKKDLSRESFDRDKVVAGLIRACAKRPVTIELMQELVDKVERELSELGTHEVPSTAIGERILTTLRDLDGVAYVRFASVYREFSGVGEFIEELNKLGAK